MIEVEHLTRRFGETVAVDDLSLTLERGEVVGLLGPNGAGKTTTMRILCGVLPASAGTVRIGGDDVLRRSLQARRRIGYLPESVPLHPEMRVDELLAFQGRLHRMPRREARRRADEVLARVGLTDVRRRLSSQLSRGMRQRAGLAVALLPNPDVLILDEPTSGLDPLQRIEVRGLVGELAAEHTVLLSSHILAEVEAMAERVVILARGRKVADGRPEELGRSLAGGDGAAGRVRVEAVVPDPTEAARLLGTLPGVVAVRDRGRLGMHHRFDVAASEDVREDVGALAAVKAWALRELSWRRPTLEALFAKVALDLDLEDEDDAPAAAAAEPTVEATGLLGEASAQAPPGAKPKGGPTLDPFEGFGGGTGGGGGGGA